MSQTRMNIIFKKDIFAFYNLEAIILPTVLTGLLNIY